MNPRRKVDVEGPARYDLNPEFDVLDEMLINLASYSGCDLNHWTSTNLSRSLAWSADVDVSNVKEWAIRNAQL